MPRKVLVLAGAGYGQVQAMFLAAGWDIANDLDDADLVQFTGGEDVNPALYGEHAHKSTDFNEHRDSMEAALYEKALMLGIPMAGICRGGQFLNVMNGGRLWQDVDRHAIYGLHDAYIYGGVMKVGVSSTHHQMMRPNYEDDTCQVLMTAGLSEVREAMFDLDQAPLTVVQQAVPSRKEDIESVYYGSTNCLCYQPHPEFAGPLYDECRDVYFSFIENYLFASEAQQKAEAIAS